MGGLASAAARHTVKLEEQMRLDLVCQLGVLVDGVDHDVVKKLCVKWRGAQTVSGGRKDGRVEMR